MILNQLSLIDCFVFLLILTPHLVLHVGLFPTAFWVLRNLPFLAVYIPIGFLYERFFTPIERQTQFIQISTPFQDLIIRYVRYAFANLPAKIGRVFLSKGVSLPFLIFRMLRHGYFSCPIHWQEINRPDFRALWILPNVDQQPDIIILYCHGGGFSLGSSYFYLEFLLAWIKLLQQSGFRNPAILSLEYTLVPDAIYPTQLNQAVAAYRYAFSIMNDDSSHICVSGDSAGGTLVLSLILRLRDSKRLQKPGLAVLVSPWVTIDSDIHTNTRSDYLDASTLHHYGAQYLNKIAIPTEESLASPGSCRNLQVWKAASPTQGWIITWGGEEMLRTDISGLVNRLEKAGLQVLALEAKGGIHAWPVAALYLGESMERRLQGLQSLVQGIRERMVSQID